MMVFHVWLRVGIVKRNKKLIMIFFRCCWLLKLRYPCPRSSVKWFLENESGGNFFFAVLAKWCSLHSSKKVFGSSVVVQRILVLGPDFESSLTLSRCQPRRNKRTVRSSTYKYRESWAIRVFGCPRKKNRRKNWRRNEKRCKNYPTLKFHDHKYLKDFWKLHLFIYLFIYSFHISILFVC